MSNNNNTRNIYNKNINEDEMEFLLNSSNVSAQTGENNQMTTIHIDNDLAPGTSQQYLQRQQNLQQIRREGGATRINMEATAANLQTTNVSGNQIDRQRLPNLLTMWQEARHQFNRSQSLPHNGENSPTNTSPRTWRENLYEVLSSNVTPRAHSQVLRAIFNPSANVRNQIDGEPQVSPRSQHNNSLDNQPSSGLRLSRPNSRLTDDRSFNDNSTLEPETPATDTSIDHNVAVAGNNRNQNIIVTSTPNGGRQTQRQNSAAASTSTTADMADDTDPNAVGELIVKIVTDFIRYLPFIFIVIVKFIHDNLLAMLDILILQAVVHFINKSIIREVAKLNKKSYIVLVRDVILVTFVVSCRFIFSTTSPDPFGIFINPAGPTITLDLTSTEIVGPIKSDSLVFPEIEGTKIPLNSTISITKGISLGNLIYYIAVNDLILKLLTQIIKIIVTMFPVKVTRPKSRARLYAVIETSSQFYRALVPIRLWLKYLFESYSGLEVISGILFSSFYVGAKLFEFNERGGALKRAVVNFVRNMDHERKPTKDELEAAGTACPICHDTFSSPVVLECGHIFCDECVSTWFKREQTCPMCRAKVSEDPTWQDGATTHFYQLC